MARIPVAVQLYSVREQAAKDLPGTLKALADMGYEGVEFAGYFDKSGAELKQLLDQFGLKAAGSHIRGHEIEADKLQASIEFHQALGNNYLIVPWIDFGQEAQAWKDFGGKLGQVAKQLAPHGMYTGYHTHAHDMHELAGSTPWDLVAQGSGEKVVMQLDLGNAAHGGADPVAYLKKYLSRSRTVHLKEYSKTNDKPLIGEGDVPWSEVLALCEGSGVTEWFIVEQEVYPVAPLEAVKRCREFLKTLGR